MQAAPSQALSLVVRPLLGKAEGAEGLASPAADALPDHHLHVARAKLGQGLVSRFLFFCHFLFTSVVF